MESKKSEIGINFHDIFTINSVMVKLRIESDSERQIDVFTILKDILIVVEDLSLMESKKSEI